MPWPADRPAPGQGLDWDAPPDEAGWIRLLLPFEKLESARAARLAFGADVEVLSPAELRSQIIATAAAVGALYAGREPPIRSEEGSVDR